MDENVQITNSTKSHPPTRFTKLVTTAVISYCTFAYGSSFTFLSPTIIDFSNKFDTDVTHLSIVFTILTGCFALGAFTFGILSNFLSRQIIVIFLLSIMSTALFALPNVSSVTLFFIFSALLGFGSGAYEALQVAWTIDIWGHESGPFILTQYFAFALGTVVPPLLLAPFLTGEEEDDEREDKTIENETNLMRISSMDNSSENPTKDSDLRIPFSIAASILVVGVLIQILLYLKVTCRQGQVSSPEKVSTHHKSEQPQQEDSSCTRTSANKIIETQPTNHQNNVIHSKWHKVTLILLSCCVIGVYQGTELVTMQFLSTFSVYADVGLSEAKGAQVLSGLTWSFAICRGVGILIVLKVAPQYILCGNILLLIGSNLILLLLAQDSVTMLWVGSVLTGVAMSTACPSAYAFIEKHLHVTDRVASTIVVTAGTMSAISPLLVGNSVKHNPSILCYVNLASIIVLSVSFGTMYWFVVVRNKNKQVDP